MALRNVTTDHERFPWINREKAYKNRDEGVEYQVLRCPCGLKYLLKDTHRWEDRVLPLDEDPDVALIIYTQRCVGCQGLMWIHSSTVVVDVF